MPAATFFPIKLLKPMTRRVLGIVNQCIYCGAREDLRNEHVIPYSLGGRDELHRATCGPCADITSALELRVVRSPAWWPLRRALDLSRHKKKQPSSFPARDVGGPEPRSVQIPIEEYPLVVPFFVFDTPAVLRGNDGFGLAGRISLWQPRPLRNTSPLQVDMSYAADDFARLLAKIALGYAVAAHSVAAFEDIFVRALVLGDVSRASAWVGGWTTGEPGFEESTVHAARASTVDGQVRVVLQLFRPPPGLSQTPVYQVIVGRMGQDPRVLVDATI
jgi:hypothetical protein